MMNGRVLIYLLFFILATFEQVLAQNKSINKVSIGGKSLCAEILKKEDFDCAPKWTDERVETPSGRDALVKLAQMKALNILGKIGEDSWLNRWCATFLMNENTQNMKIKFDYANNRERAIEYLTLPETWNADNSQINFSIRYSRPTRKSNSAGASVPKLQRINSIYRRDSRTGDCYCGDDLIIDGRSSARPLGYEYWDWKSNSVLAGGVGRPTKLASTITSESLNIEKDNKCKDCFICYREELNINIEIFPELFERGYLQIPTEFDSITCTYYDKKSKSNIDTTIFEPRYARDPIEAIIYIVLHEIGHIETFLSKESRCGFKYDRELIAQDSSEESEWEFASSVMHYEEDLDLISIFEKCINDMPNRFNNLKSDYIETLPSFYVFNTNISKISIDNLEFESKIFKSKKSAGTALSWSWNGNLEEKYIDKDRADKVTNEMLNAFQTLRVFLRFNYQTTDKGTIIKWLGKTGTNDLQIDYTIGEKGNIEIPEGKVKSITVTFFVNM